MIVGALAFTIISILGIVLTSLVITRIRIWKPKRTFWFAAVYFACGIAAFMYLLFVSGNVEKVESHKVLQQQLEENEQLMADLKVRKFDSLKKEHLKFTETFEAKEETVEIVRNDNSYYLPVVISWNDSPDNKIVASYYETPLYLNRVNIAPFVESPKIEFKENKLYILESETEVTAKSMYLSIDLLNPESFPRSDDRLNDLIARRILHLNVPKHFNIIDNGGWYW
ncbi:glucose-6-phosphate isomerase [Solibacillus silvestris]|uniref:glucose-6-phosphate isomerase n=1 Tax=Solibacillus silvestris TaxID=76853 RepID=UPI003F7D3F7B